MSQKRIATTKSKKNSKGEKGHRPKEQNHTTIAIRDRDFVNWLKARGTMAETMEDVLKRLTGFSPREKIDG